MFETNHSTVEFPEGVAPLVLPKRLAVSDIYAGQLLLVGYKYRGELLSIQKAKFEGFNAGGCNFFALHQLKAFRGCRTLKQLEDSYKDTSAQLKAFKGCRTIKQLEDAYRGVPEVKAEFSRIGPGEPLREAFLYNGTFRVGSNEYTLYLEPISNHHD